MGGLFMSSDIQKRFTMKPFCFIFVFLYLHTNRSWWVIVLWGFCFLMCAFRHLFFSLQFTCPSCVIRKNKGVFEKEMILANDWASTTRKVQAEAGNGVSSFGERSEIWTQRIPEAGIRKFINTGKPSPWRVPGSKTGTTEEESGKWKRWGI